MTDDKKRRRDEAYEALTDLIVEELTVALAMRWGSDWKRRAAPDFTADDVRQMAEMLAAAIEASFRLEKRARPDWTGEDD